MKITAFRVLVCPASPRVSAFCGVAIYMYWNE
jgi:hypothetical protein